MKKAILVLAVLGVMAVAAPSAHAACGTSLPLLHGFDSYFQCDNSKGPVTAYAYLISSPTGTNTGPVSIARDLGAGKVDIQSDWSIGGVVGCPQDASGNHRVMIVVQANDGTGLMTSISGASSTLAFPYTVETSQQFLGFDDTGKVLAAPLQCGSLNGRPRILNVGPTAVNVHIDPPHIFSDCDPGTLGEALGDACVDGFGGTQGTIARIWTSNQPCGTRPDVRTSLWTATALTVPAAGGDVSVPYTKPNNGTKICATDPTCLCAFVGTTSTVGGQESTGIGGFIQVAGQLSAPATAENIRATADSGKVKLSWGTSNEVGLAGFRLIAVSKTKGQFEIGSLIAANGSGSYTAEARMGDLKGSRSIIIRSVLNDGTTVDAAPVNF